MKLLQLKSTEENCRLLFKKFRIKQGICCKKCSGHRHFWLEGKWQWQCVKCKFRTTLTSGTVLENTKLPIQTWFLCLHYMLDSKKGMSALEIQRHTERKRYEPIWSLLHKIRKRMAISEELNLLSNSIVAHLGTIQVRDSPNSEFSTREFHILTYRECEKNFLKLSLGDYNEESKASKKLVSAGRYAQRFEDKSITIRDHQISPRLGIELINLKKKLFGIHHGVQIDYLNNYISEHAFKRNNWGEDLYMMTIFELLQLRW
jgi:hypothetical protein